MNKLRPTSKEVIWIAILFGWTAFHFILLQGPKSEYKKYNFWPFEKGITIYSYDLSEFTSYVMPVWVMFVVYYFLIRVAAQPKKP